MRGKIVRARPTPTNPVPDPAGLQPRFDVVLTTHLSPTFWGVTIRGVGRFTRLRYSREPRVPSNNAQDYAEDPPSYTRFINRGLARLGVVVFANCTRASRPKILVSERVCKVYDSLRRRKNLGVPSLSLSLVDFAMYKISVCGKATRAKLITNNVKSKLIKTSRARGES